MRTDATRSLAAGALVPFRCIGRTVCMTYGDRDREIVGRLERFDTRGLLLSRRGHFGIVRDSVGVAEVRDVEVLVATRREAAHAAGRRGRARDRRGDRGLANQPR